MARHDHGVHAVMRPLPLALAAAVLLAAPARAQPAPPPQPPSVTLTGPELDGLIQALAEAPAKYSLVPLNFLLDKRQRAAAPAAEREAPASPEPKAP